MRAIFSALALFTVVFCFTGCKKYNQVDNSGTVKTPYILYIGGYYGTLHKTNDALYFNSLFPTDASTVRQILAADTMLMYLKGNFYFSRNEGSAFKQSNDHPRDFEDLFYKYFLPNQSLYETTSKRVYLCSQTGLEYSTDNGETFTQETNWAAGSAAITPTSITQLDNGNLYIIRDTDNVYQKQPGGSWTRINQTTPLPLQSSWYITDKNNTLFAIDFLGTNGIYYSNNGADWTACTGIPKSRKILFGTQALSLNNTFFAGLDSGGLYRLDATGTNFTTSTIGIPWYAKVHFVAGKKVVYRTDVERYYHFCATDIGLYISENDGKDWRKLRDGAYSSLY
ncbi:MAG: hypothetical protein IPI46_05040 [Bacteroidetes bacterium]|nr:hypothetical protein [Bacteroidota bacterium]